MASGQTPGAPSTPLQQHPPPDPQQWQHRSSTPPGDGLSTAEVARHAIVTMLLPPMTSGAAYLLWQFLCRTITGKLPQTRGVTTTEEMRLLLHFADWEDDDSSDGETNRNCSPQPGSAEC